MSTFFKALEQAERERTTGRAARPLETIVDERPGPDAVREPPPAPAAADESTTAAATWSAERSRHADDGRRPPGAVEAPWGEVDEHLVSLLRPSSPEAEQYRGLRHAIHKLGKTTGLAVIAVSSPTSGDGKTTTAINLAGALAQAPQAQVLLVDLDLRTATAAKRLGLAGLAGPGLVDAIRNPDLALEDVVRRYETYNLCVLPAGPSLVAPHQLLDSPRLGALLDHARQHYDYVVLDTPPIISVLDGRVIGKWVDGFLLVVAAHRTPRRLLEEALNLMEPSKVIGLVFNRIDQHLVSYYYG